MYIHKEINKFLQIWLLKIKKKYKVPKIRIHIYVFMYIFVNKILFF